LRTPPGVTFLVGGARSGKSDVAMRLADAWRGPVTFVATAEPDDDPTFAHRIERHRSVRPAAWHTVEEPRDLAQAIAGIDTDRLVLVDCLSVWVSNLMADGLTEDGAVAVGDALADAVGRRRQPVVLVSNEVGLGVHPSTPVGREYRDVLGRVNRRVAERADRTYLVVTGHLLALTGPEDVFR
jgi:adenosyl cobinamide kinase/adenosyl cobinamide phosphate guanylyltransferase